MHEREERWIRAYQAKEALWFHDGNMKRPHAALTSGKHSDGFFNSKLVTEDPVLLLRAAADLVGLFQEYGGDIEIVDRVVGPATGATALAKAIAVHITLVRGRACYFASPKPEKDVAGKKVRMVFGETRVIPGEMVLLCEDVVSTGESVQLTREAVDANFGDTLPYILALVNRGDHLALGGKSIVALINRHMPMWAPDECPLCKAGSEAIRPKEPGNWARLNATY